MTVEELIRELKNYDPDSDACLAFNGELHNIETVEWGRVFCSDADQAFDRLGAIVFAEKS